MTRSCDHDNLLDFDCLHPCPNCGASGPHNYSEDAYCDTCGAPHREYYRAIRNLISAAKEQP